MQSPRVQMFAGHEDPAGLPDQLVQEEVVQEEGQLQHRAVT